MVRVLVVLLFIGMLVAVLVCRSSPTVLSTARAVLKVGAVSCSNYENKQYLQTLVSPPCRACQPH